MHSFDKNPIYDDLDILSRWWEKRLESSQPALALYYNTISLHDGNIRVGETSGSSMRTYPDRVHRLLNNIDRFTAIVKQSGRAVALIVVA